MRKREAIATKETQTPAFIRNHRPATKRRAIPRSGILCGQVYQFRDKTVITQSGKYIGLHSLQGGPPLYTGTLQFSYSVRQQPTKHIDHIRTWCRHSSLRNGKSHWWRRKPATLENSFQNIEFNYPPQFSICHVAESHINNSAARWQPTTKSLRTRYLL